jgi:hypothetical protein
MTGGNVYHPGASSKTPGSPYSRICETINQLIASEDAVDPTVCAYIIASVALAEVSRARGSERAAEIAYMLADDLSTKGGAR